MQDITIYDIARMAGVSPSTVSRVINNKPNISKATREKIEKILKENHYVPNEQARGLVNQSTHIIGILINDIRKTHHTNGIYYMQREFDKSGYSCLIYNTGSDGKDISRCLQLLSQRKVEGVVMMGSVFQSKEVKQAVEAYLPSTPVMLCNGYLDAPNIYGVLSDERQGTKDCVKLFHERGCKCPALIMNPPTPSGNMKVKGFLDGMKRYYPEIAEPIVRHDAGNGESLTALIREVLTTHPEVDALLFAEDAMAMVGLRVCGDLHKWVPQDIRVMGINNSDTCQYAIPTLSSLDNVLFDVSITAARELLLLLDGAEVNKKVTLSTSIVERESTGLGVDIFPSTGHVGTVLKR